MDTDGLALTRSAPAHAGVLEASVTLAQPQSRLYLRLPRGDAGRAEAELQGRSDEALPAGAIRLRIPFRAARPGQATARTGGGPPIDGARAELLRCAP